TACTWKTCSVAVLTTSSNLPCAAASDSAMATWSGGYVSPCRTPQTSHCNAFSMWYPAILPSLPSFVPTLAVTRHHIPAPTSHRRGPISATADCCTRSPCLRAAHNSTRSEERRVGKERRSPPPRSEYAPATRY